MIQLKQRDFMAKFGHYKNDEVEIIGRHDEVVGVYLPKTMLSKIEGYAKQDKKEIADKIVEEMMKGQVEVPQGVNDMVNRRWKEMGEFKKVGRITFDDPGCIADMSKDSTDNAEMEKIKNSELDYREGRYEVVDPNNEKRMNQIFGLEEDDTVGVCDICKHASKELWEHEEEGIERNVCRNCFEARAVSMGFAKPAQLESFLRTKKKVGYEKFKEFSSVGTKPLITLKTPAKFTEFNPIPKPVKKEKKS